MAVDYDLNGDNSTLVRALEESISKLSQSIDATNRLKEAEEKLRAEEKRLADEQAKLKEAADKKNKAFADSAEVYANVTEGLSFTFEAIKGVAEGLNEMVREVVDAREELAGFMDAADRKSLDRLNDRLEVLDKSVLLLKASVVTELQPGLETMIDTFLGASEKITPFIDKLSDLRDASNQALSWITFGASDKAREFFETITEDGKVAREELEELIKAEKEWNAAIEEGERLAEEWAKEAEEGKRRAEEAAKKAAEEEKKAAEAAKKAAEDKLKAEEALQKDLARLRAEGLQRYLDTIEAEAEAATTLAEELIARNEEVTAAFEAELEARREATKQAVSEIAGAYLELFTQLSEWNLEAKQEDLDAIRERKAETRAAIKEAEGDERRLLEGRLAAIKTQEEEAKKAARRAFAISQASAVANVIASSAEAFMGLLATFAPLGPFAPVAAGAIVAPALATQLAAIGKNKAPAHSGAVLGADEFFVGNQLVRQGERGVVFNQRAVESGAVERAMAENRGQGGQAAPAPMQLVITDGNRALAYAVARDARRPSSPLAAAFGSVSNVVDPWRR